MGGECGNWIGGSWRPVGDGGGFVVGDGAGGELGRRPRAGGAELEEALGVLGDASGSWWGRGPEERGEIVRALDWGSELGVCARGLGARMGIGEERALELLEDDLEEVERGEVAGVAEPGVALVRCAAGGLLSGLVPLVTGALERGWTVLLLADPALPWMAEAAVRAWTRAGGDVGALCVLHDDGETVARAAARSGCLAGALLRGEVAGLAELEAAMAPRGAAAFGAGVLEVSAEKAVFEGIGMRDVTAVVTSECDVEEEAFSVCEAALGAAEALGGERDGCVGRVVCHERLFSAFTRAFLECVDELAEDEGGLLRPLGRGLRGWVGELTRVAVGEGATWLRGGASDSISKAGRAKMTRSVFTNVEPNWRLARADRPSPALALIRASDDDRARELALACDASHSHASNSHGPA